MHTFPDTPDCCSNVLIYFARDLLHIRDHHAFLQPVEMLGYQQAAKSNLLCKGRAGEGRSTPLVSNVGQIELEDAELLAFGFVAVYCLISNLQSTKANMCLPVPLLPKPALCLVLSALPFGRAAVTGLAPVAAARIAAIRCLALSSP